MPPEHPGFDPAELPPWERPTSSVPATAWTATGLLEAVFPEPRWAVPGLIAEGLTLLVGAPKVGKSWWALNTAVAVAAGGQALGKVPVVGGAVLYLALEDTARRLQRRLRMVLGDDPAPAGLHFDTAWPRIDHGGCAQVVEWLKRQPHARLVVVDVLARVRPLPNENGSVYASDYAALAPLKALADHYGVAVLVLHHTRKARGEDFVETVSGTHGLAGAADAILVMARARNAADAELHVTGRDIEEAAHAMRFDPSRGLWTLLAGPVTDYQVSDQRRSILKAVRQEEGIGPNKIAAASGIDHDVVKHLVRKMLDDDLSTDGKGHYYPVHSVHPVHPTDSSGERSERSERPLVGPCRRCDARTGRQDGDGSFRCSRCKLAEEAA